MKKTILFLCFGILTIGFGAAGDHAFGAETETGAMKALSWFFSPAKCREEAAGYFTSGNYDNAIRCYDKAIEFDTAGACGVSKGYAYFYRGLSYYAKRSYDQAIKDFDKAIEFDQTGDCGTGKKGAAYYERGAVYYDKGLYDRAKTDYNKSKSLYDGQEDFYPYYGEEEGSGGDEPVKTETNKKAKARSK